MRTDPVQCPAFQSIPQLANLYGFAWNTSSPDNAVSPLSLVWALVEYENGSFSRLLVKPGTWYGGPTLMSRVSLWSAANAQIVIDWSDIPGESTTPANSPQGDGFVEEFIGPVSTANAQGVPLDFDFYRPKGARALSLLYSAAGLVDAGAARRWELHAFDSSGRDFMVNGAWVTGGTASGATVWTRLLLWNPDVTASFAGSGYSGAPSAPLITQGGECLPTRVRMRWTATAAGVQLNGVTVASRWSL